MEGIGGFENVAPFLKNPVVLVGFALLLVFGIHRTLLKAKIIPKLTQKTGGRVVQALLRYGFVIALLVILFGFLFAFSQEHLKHTPGQAEQGRLAALADMAKSAYCQRRGDLSESERQEVVHACSEAIIALAHTGTTNPKVTTGPQIEDALEQLSDGDTNGAKAIFGKVLAESSAEGAKANREAAEAARHLGALAYEDDTKAALEMYQKAVQLDPDNSEGWLILGDLRWLTGDKSGAVVAYKRIQELGDSTRELENTALVSSELGFFLKAGGHLLQAEAEHEQALVLDAVVGNKEGMAKDYNNLGNIYEQQGDLVQAEASYKKALALNEGLGSKEGMAQDYDNLGTVYQRRGNLVQAEASYKKALALFKAVGDLDSFKQVQGIIAALHRRKEATAKL